MRTLQSICGILLALCAGVSSGQTTLRLGNAQADTSAFQAGVQAFADDFAKRTQGRYKINILANGMLGGEG